MVTYTSATKGAKHQNKGLKAMAKAMAKKVASGAKVTDAKVTDAKASDTKAIEIAKAKKRIMDIETQCNQSVMILTSRLYQTSVDWQALVDRITKAKPADYSSAVKIVRHELSKADAQIAANIRYGCTRRLLAALSTVKAIGPWSAGQADINWL